MSDRRGTKIEKIAENKKKNELERPISAVVAFSVFCMSVTAGFSIVAFNWNATTAMIRPANMVAVLWFWRDGAPGLSEDIIVTHSFVCFDGGGLAVWFYGN